MNHKRNINTILAAVILLLAVGCQLFYEPRNFYSAQAEITSIEKASDTSVLVDIKVLNYGNADACRLSIYFDTIPIQRGPTLSSQIITGFISDCRLDRTYTITVSPFSKGQKYFFQLFQDGRWNSNGITSRIGRFIGSQQEFIIQ